MSQWNRRSDNDISSLILPTNIDMRIFDENNWRFREEKTQTRTGVIRIVIKCLVDGYDELVYDVEGTENDINKLAGGEPEYFINYVKNGFFCTLDKKKKEHKTQLAKLAGLSLVTGGMF